MKNFDCSPANNRVTHEDYIRLTKEIEELEIENNDLRNIANLTAELLSCIHPLKYTEKENCSNLAWDYYTDLKQSLTEMGYEI